MVLSIVSSAKLSEVSGNSALQSTIGMCVIGCLAWTRDSIVCGEVDGALCSVRKVGVDSECLFVFLSTSCVCTRARRSFLRAIVDCDSGQAAGDD